jgi:hypothetical protein
MMGGLGGFGQQINPLTGLPMGMGQQQMPNMLNNQMIEM